MTQSSSARSQLRPYKGQPDVTHHSHSGTQPCGWAARMVLKKFLYVLFYRTRKFFDCKRGHINRNVQGSRFGLKSSKRELPLRDESDARTHRTQLRRPSRGRTWCEGHEKRRL